MTTFLTQCLIQSFEEIFSPLSASAVKLAIFQLFQEGGSSGNIYMHIHAACYYFCRKTDDFPFLHELFQVHHPLVDQSVNKTAQIRYVSSVIHRLRAESHEDSAAKRQVPDVITAGMIDGSCASPPDFGAVASDLRSQVESGAVTGANEGSACVLPAPSGSQSTTAHVDHQPLSSMLDFGNHSRIFAKYTCKVCNKSFSTSSHLNRHKRIHTGERPFACKFCGNAFRESSHLRNHERIHTGERPFSCKTCGRDFTRHAILQAHERCHRIV